MVADIPCGNVGVGGCWFRRELDAAGDSYRSLLADVGGRCRAMVGAAGHSRVLAPLGTQGRATPAPLAGSRGNPPAAGNPWPLRQPAWVRSADSIPLEDCQQVSYSVWVAPQARGQAIE